MHFVFKSMALFFVTTFFSFFLAALGVRWECMAGGVL